MMAAAGWTEIRVFISSPFQDMQAERQVLLRSVFPALREKLERHRIHLTEIDLRWGITAEQVENEQALELCLRQVDACPFFVALLGERYGQRIESYPASAVEKYAWLERPEHAGSSITALEIEHVLGGSRSAEDCCFCLRDASFLERVPEPERSGIYLEPDPRAARRLRALKRRIRKSGSPLLDGYACRWSSEKAAAESHTQGGHEVLPAFGQFVETRLWRSFCRHFPRLEEGESRSPRPDAYPVEPPWSAAILADELDVHRRFLESRLRVFVGRAKLLRQLASYLEGDEVAPRAVVGAPGCGKTTVLAKLYAEHREKHPADLVLPHFIGASPRSTRLSSLLWRLCAELRRAFGWTDEELPLDALRLQRTLRNFMARVPADRRVVLLLDALDELEGVATGGELLWLPPVTLPHVKVIASLTGQDPARDVERRGFVPRQVPPLTRTEQRRILREIPLLSAKTLSKTQLDILSANPATKNPLFLSVALEELRGFGSFQHLDQRIDALERGDPETLFVQVLLRLDRELPDQLAFRVLASLHLSRHGLSEEELADLTRELDSSDDLPVLLRELRPYLLRRGRLFGIYHGSLARAIAGHYLAADNGRQILHADLAHCFRHRCRPDLRLPSEARSHALAELVFHQVEGGLWGDLETTLTDAELLEARVATASASDLRADFDQALSRLPASRARELLAAIRGALEHERAHLDRAPSGLLQQILDHLLLSAATDQHVVDRVEEIARRRRPAGPWLRRLFPLHRRDATRPLKTFPSLDDRSSALSLAFSPDGRLLCVGETGGLRIWDTVTDREVHRIELGTSERIVARRGASSSQAREFMICHSPDIVLWRPGAPQIVSISRELTFFVWDLESGNDVPADFEVDELLQAPRFQEARGVVFRGDPSAVRTFEHLLAETPTSAPDSESTFFRRPFSTKADEAFRHHVVNDLFAFDAAGTALSRKPYGMCLNELHRRFSGDPSLPLSQRLFPRAFDGLRRQLREIHALALDSANDLLVISDSADFVGPRIDVWHLKKPPETFKDRMEWMLRDKLQWRSMLGKDVDLAATRLAVSADGTLVAASFADQSIWLWQLEHPSEPSGPRLTGHLSPVLGLAFDPEGRRLASCSFDGDVHLWSIPRRLEPRAIEPFQDQGRLQVPIRSLRVHPSGRWVAAALEHGGTEYYRYDASSGRLSEIPPPVVGGERAPAVAFHPDGRQLLLARNGELVGLEVRQERRGLRWRRVATIAADHEFPIVSCQFSPDGRYLAAYSDLAFGVWSWPRGEPLAHIADDVTPQAPNSFDFSPDGRLAIGLDEKVSIIDTAPLRVADTLEGHARDVKCCAFSPDGKLLVTGSIDGDLRLWNMERAEQVGKPLSADSGWVHDCVFTPDGQLVVSAHHDASLHLWRVADGEEINIFQTTDLGRAVYALDASTLLYGDVHGGLNTLRLIHHDADPAIVTAARAWFGHVVLCASCRHKNRYRAAQLGTVQACRGCGRRLRLNPFALRPRRLPNLSIPL